MVDSIVPMSIFHLIIILWLYKIWKLAESGCDRLNTDPQKRHVQGPSLSTYQCDVIWKQGLCIELAIHFSQSTEQVPEKISATVPVPLVSVLPGGSSITRPHISPSYAALSFWELTHMPQMWVLKYVTCTCPPQMCSTYGRQRESHETVSWFMHRGRLGFCKKFTKKEKHIFSHTSLNILKGLICSSE